MFRKTKMLWFGLIFTAVCAFPAMAKDSISHIMNINIKVDRNIQDLEPGENLGNISEADFPTGNTDRYHVDAVQWIDSGNADTLRVGSEPKVKLYLTADSKDKPNGDTLYYQFFGAYNSSNVRVNNASFVSARRISATELEVILQLRPIAGTYDAPDNLAWSENSLGRASWTAGDNSSGYFEVKLLKEGKQLAKITTDARSLNLYPWMTEEGSYTFSVKSIPYTDSQKKSGKASDETESDTLQITSGNRSTGAGKYGEIQIFGQNAEKHANTTIPSTIGWSQMNGKWYFRYPNSQPAVNAWLDWNGHWYHFNGQGEMETGWFKSTYGNWFYLDPTNGDAKTGWRLINNVWYYFTPEQGDRQCIMLSGGIFPIGQESYYFDGSGAMRTGWIGVMVNGKQIYYYFRESGAMVKNTTINGFRLNEQGQWVS